MYVSIRSLHDKFLYSWKVERSYKSKIIQFLVVALPRVDGLSIAGQLN